MWYFLVYHTSKTYITKNLILLVCQISKISTIKNCDFPQNFHFFTKISISSRCYNRTLCETNESQFQCQRCKTRQKHHAKGVCKNCYNALQREERKRQIEIKYFESLKKWEKKSGDNWFFWCKNRLESFRKYS